MHLQFYHLKRPPFQLATDLDFFRDGKNYDQSLDVLKYSLEHHGGLSLLTGKAGSGKSMIVRGLLNALGDSVRAAVLPDSSLTRQEFYDLVAHGFDLPGAIENRRDFHDRIHDLLQDARASNQHVLLVVDEAQQLSRELIDEIGELVNLQPVDSGGIGICLVGQADTAQDPAMRISRPFENHVIVHYHLAPFSLDETGKYIRHRLKVAGADRSIFTDDAVREIHQCSGGYPGQINIICDLALFTGYTEKAAEIGQTVIRNSAAKLQFPGMPGESGHTCSAGIPADPEKEDRVIAPDEKNEAEDATEGVVESVAATRGRSFTRPALAVLMALVFVGGGYVVYMQRGDGQLSITPTGVDPPPVVDTTPVPAPATGKEQTGFDAVGYSPPQEDDFSRQQSVGVETTTVAATGTSSVAAGNSGAENTDEVAGEAVTLDSGSIRDHLEVQALQVEESLSQIPVAGDVSTPERVDVKTPFLPETASVAVGEAAAVETVTVPEEKIVEFSTVAEPVAESAGNQQVAMDVDIPVAETRPEMEKITSAPMNRVGKSELEHFFEAGAFVSQSSSSQVIKTIRHPRTIGASLKIETKIDPTPQPDPEDVIDWLLKKKEQHAQ